MLCYDKYAFAIPASNGINEEIVSVQFDGYPAIYLESASGKLSPEYIEFF